VWCGRASAPFTMKHAFEQRKANRIGNAENQAAQKEAASHELYLRSTKMASIIPMGQPILVGQHSEKNDRSYRDKIRDNGQIGCGGR
jgi:hypothetical protein